MLVGRPGTKLACRTLSTANSASPTSRGLQPAAKKVNPLTDSSFLWIRKKPPQVWEIIAAATPTGSKEADLPFGRMGMVGLEPVYGIYPVQPVGAFSCRRTRQKSLGDLYVYKVSNIMHTDHTTRFYT